MKVFAAYTPIFCLMSMISHAHGSANGVHHGSQRSLRHSYDPVQDDVTSPPVFKYTENPLHSPTAPPSTNPTGVPTDKPRPFSSFVPSKEPSILPSAFPSSMPSTAPTGVFPTASEIPSSGIPSNSLSPPLEIQGCIPDEGGLFGSESNAQVVVKFAYELETKNSIASTVIPPLENAFSATILPGLFSDQCSQRIDNDVLRRRIARRRLAATGVSTRPEDIVLESVSCGQKNAQSNNCAVVQGELTIFLLEGARGEDETVVTENIIQILKNGMVKGEFLYAHPDIERVTFISLSAVPKLVAASEDSPTPAPSTNGAGLNVLWGVIATVAGLALILAAFVWRRKQKDEETEGDSEAHEGSLDPEVDQSIDQAESLAGEA